MNTDKLELATVHVCDVAEDGGSGGEETAGGGRWRLVRCGTAAGGALWLVQQLLLHAGLLPQLFEPQLVLPLPLGPGQAQSSITHFLQLYYT